MTKENTPVEALKPQLDLIPESAMKDLQRLAEIKGYSLHEVIAGWWIRFGEVQTLQIELDYKSDFIKEQRHTIGTFMQEISRLSKRVNELSALIEQREGEAVEFKNWCDKITAMLDEDGDTIVNTYSGLDYNKSYTTQQLHALYEKATKTL